MPHAEHMMSSLNWNLVRDEASNLIFKLVIWHTDCAHLEIYLNGLERERKKKRI